jgi:hypothetical protein
VSRLEVHGARRLFPPCSRARPACQTEVPPLQTVRGEQRAACLFPLEEPA